MRVRSKLAGIAIGLAAAAGILLWQARERPAPAYNLLAENEGKIRAVALQYTEASALYSGPCYRDFLRQVGPSVEVTAVCGTRADEDSFRRDVRSWGIAHPERIHTLVIGQPITGWCKDRFLVAESGKTLLIHPPARDTGLSTRTHDALVAPALAKSDPGRFDDISVKLEFDSGDIVATRERVIFCDTLQRKNPGMITLDTYLAQLFGRKVIHLKGVPDHHIGMFAAPLDEQTVLVGDPRLAKPFWTPKLEQEYGKSDFSIRVQRLFDAATDQLRTAGFRVVRVPTVYLGPQTYITYTNAVFEANGRNKTVYMPVYDLNGTDGIARKAYESLGWKVRPIHVKTVYRFRGTIGCLVNVLERG